MADEEDEEDLLLLPLVFFRRTQDRLLRRLQIVGLKMGGPTTDSTMAADDADGVADDDAADAVP